MCFDGSFPCLRQTGFHFSVDKNETKILLHHTFRSQSLRPATSNGASPTLLFLYFSDTICNTNIGAIFYICKSHFFIIEVIFHFYFTIKSK